MSPVFAVTAALGGALLADVRDFLDRAATPGYLHLYSTVRPTTAGAGADAPAAVIVFSRPCGVIDAEQLQLHNGETGGYQVPADATIVWCRLFDGDGTWALEGDVSDAAGGGALRLEGTGTAVYGGGYVLLGTAAVGQDTAVSTDFTAAGAMRYTSRTARPVVNQVQSHYQYGLPVRNRVQVRWADALATKAPVQVRWQEAMPLQETLQVRWQQCLPLDKAVEVRWQAALRLQAQAVVGRYQQSVRLHVGRTARYQAALRLRANLLAVRYQQSIRTNTGLISLYQDALRAEPVAVQGRFQQSQRLPVLWRSRYQDAIGLPVGAWAGGPRPDPGTDPDPEHTTYYILPARTYMAVHSLIAHRLPDLVEVPLYAGTTLSADEGSFAWSLSATGPQDLFDLLSPIDGVPQQIRITLDGLVWVFVVSPPERSFAFGKRAASISGKSVTALLGASWQREVQYNNSSAATAQQLAVQALDLTGIGLDWGLTDWLVPSNAWSRTATPLAAVQAIAEAAGGYLQSHRSEPTLQVRHPYPSMSDGSPGGPWNWALGAADVELAPDAIIGGNLTRGEFSDVNAVYVSGTTQGVLALVKRSGTPGDKLGPLQTDPLIVHIDAATQRGLAILGKAGIRYDVPLELPILTGLTQPGVIDVGRLVQINDATPWRGRVRSVSVTHNSPQARQTIVLERHL